VEDDLDKIAALWPADDDHEELLRFILSERIARRNQGHTKQNPQRI